MLHLADQELQKAVRGQQRLRLLEEGGLVGRATSFRHEEKPVGVAIHRLDVDLGRQVGTGVDLPVHVERYGLRVTEILFGISLVHTLREGHLILPAGPHLLPFFGDDGCGASVLAYREFELGGNLGVAQERHCHALVVPGCLRIAQNPAHGFVVFRAEEEGDVTHRLIGNDSQRFGIDFEDLVAFEGSDGNIFVRAPHLPVLGLVHAERVWILINERFGCHLVKLLYCVALFVRHVTGSAPAMAPQ
jgi:hypothetical protein